MSSDVVYGMFCKKSKVLGWLYHKHVSVLSLIKRKNNDSVAMHLYTNEHTVDNFSLIGIEKLFKDET